MSTTVHDLVLRAEQVVTPGGVAALEVGVFRGEIVSIAPLGTGLRGERIDHLSAAETLVPGLVDTHVHVNEPGRTEWEGFASATRAAAAGGVTTIIDMPLNSIPPTVSAAALETKRVAAAGDCFVDVGFWGGAVPASLGELEPLVREGVFGFKCFLLHSGVDEFPSLTAEELEKGLREIAALHSVMVVHAEDPAVIDEAPDPHGRRYESFLASRPDRAEREAVATVIERARRTGARTHILHLSAASALPLIAAAKSEGIRLSVETCPHYLLLNAEGIAEGQTAFKCCPPIRDAGNADALWEALENGLIDCVVTDHSPSTVDLKDPEHGDFGVAWGGISSLQLGLSAVWTGARERGIPLEQVVSWMATRPAELFDVSGKGRIEVGARADFAVFAAERSFTVRANELHHRNPLTPYEGRRLFGVVERTYLAGRAIDEVPRGELLRRTYPAMS